MGGGPGTGGGGPQAASADEPGGANKPNDGPAGEASSGLSIEPENDALALDEAALPPATGWLPAPAAWRFEALALSGISRNALLPRLPPVDEAETGSSGTRAGGSDVLDEIPAPAEVCDC